MKCLRYFLSGAIIGLYAASIGMAEAPQTEPRHPISVSQRIRIAAIFALTGDNSEQTSTSLRGVRLAVSSVNESGGILGQPIELMVFDNASTPIGSRIAAMKAVKANVAGFVGPDFSSHALAVAKVAQENRIPMVANAAVNSAVTQVGSYIFRACFTDHIAGDILGEFAGHHLNAHKAAVLSDIISDDSMGMAEHFTRRFQEIGGIVTQFQYKHRDKAFEPLLRQIAAMEPDIVFLPGGAESGHIIRQAKDIGLNPIFIGGDGWGDSFFFQHGGKALSQGYYSTHWSNTQGQNQLPKFLAHLPDQIVAAKLVLGFDAATLLFNAIERAGSTIPENVVQALAQTRSFRGISGNITMNSTGDPIKPVYIRRIVNGKDDHFKTVHPGP